MTLLELGEAVSIYLLEVARAEFQCLPESERPLPLVRQWSKVDASEGSTPLGLRLVVLAATWEHLSSNGRVTILPGSPRRRKRPAMAAFAGYWAALKDEITRVHDSRALSFDNVGHESSRPDPRISLGEFFESFVECRNLLSHSEEVKVRDAKVSFTATPAYLQAVNPLLCAALQELLEEIRPLALGFPAAHVRRVEVTAEGHRAHLLILQGTDEIAWESLVPPELGMTDGQTWLLDERRNPLRWIRSRGVDPGFRDEAPPPPASAWTRAPARVRQPGLLFRRLMATLSLAAFLGIGWWWIGLRGDDSPRGPEVPVPRPHWRLAIHPDADLRGLPWTAKDGPLRPKPDGYCFCLQGPAPKWWCCLCIRDEVRAGSTVVSAQIFTSSALTESGWTLASDGTIVGGWRPGGRTLETVLILSAGSGPGDEALERLRSEAERAATGMALPPHAQLVWVDGAVIMEPDSDRKEPASEEPLPPWAGAVLEVLGSLPGLDWNGRTYAVDGG